MTKVDEMIVLNNMKMKRDEDLAKLFDQIKDVETRHDTIMQLQLAKL